MAAQKKTLPKTSKAPARSAAKSTRSAKPGGTGQSTRVNFLVMLFTLLSIVFAVVSMWRYW